MCKILHKKYTDGVSKLETKADLAPKPVKPPKSDGATNSDKAHKPVGVPKLSMHPYLMGKPRLMGPPKPIKMFGHPQISKWA